MHSGCADPCEFPKCGSLDCIISGSGGLRSRSPLTATSKENKVSRVASFTRKRESVLPTMPVLRLQSRCCCRAVTIGGRFCMLQAHMPQPPPPPPPPKGGAFRLSLTLRKPHWIAHVTVRGRVADGCDLGFGTRQAQREAYRDGGGWDDWGSRLPSRRRPY